MGLVWETEVEPVAVTDGETVWVKTHFSHDDKLRMQNAAATKANIVVTKRLAMLMEASRGGGLDTIPDDEVLGQVPLTGDVREAEWMALELAIQRWTYRYPPNHPLAGQDVPLTPDNIRRMGDEDFNLVRAAINELTSSRSEESKTESAPPSRTTSSPESKAERSGIFPMNSRTSESSNVSAVS